MNTPHDPVPKHQLQHENPQVERQSERTRRKKQTENTFTLIQIAYATVYLNKEREIKNMGCQPMKNGNLEYIVEG